MVLQGKAGGLWTLRAGGLWTLRALWQICGIFFSSFFFLFAPEEITAAIEMRRARFVLIYFCHSVFLGISSPCLIKHDQSLMFQCLYNMGYISILASLKSSGGISGGCGTTKICFISQ